MPDSASPEPDVRPTASAEPPARYVGLDVHKRQITYCILDHAGATLREGEIELTRELLTKFASTQSRPTDHVVLESTTNCWAVAEVLQQHVQDVVVSNPMATKAKIGRAHV